MAVGQVVGVTEMEAEAVEVVGGEHEEEEEGRLKEKLLEGRRGGRGKK